MGPLRKFSWRNLEKKNRVKKIESKERKRKYRYSSFSINPTVVGMVPERRLLPKDLEWK